MILLSFFDNFFSKLHSINDYGTRQQVSENFHHKGVITYYRKKILFVGWVCIPNKIKALPSYMFSYHVKPRLLSR